ncbi:hypothetical protein SCLCIDRAFT_587036 [Scleroderma citrinum Foug A]|uniref:Uncharacterized protein n=1 Tax=Scleroderma citrinum Foug A TaxID=1036808 RepID=A0A0C2YQS0_9AGAM|nr:hypothetical protein SCLCIDRAFT_587036 [Scleroderma citrinum Foug A]
MTDVTQSVANTWHCMDRYLMDGESWPFVSRLLQTIRSPCRKYTIYNNVPGQV